MISAAESYIALNARGAHLSWQPSPETDTQGYEIWISNQKGGPYSKIHEGFIEKPSYITSQLRFGTYHFVITAMDYNNNRSLLSTEVSVTIW